MERRRGVLCEEADSEGEGEGEGVGSAGVPGSTASCQTVDWKMANDWDRNWRDVGRGMRHRSRHPRAPSMPREGGQKRA